MTSDRFQILDAGLPGLKVVQRTALEDSRGHFSRLFCAETFQAVGFTSPISQINHTSTRRIGTVRGLHFQHPPHAEIKLVTCLKGRIFDVAVDLRQGSPTFLQWKGLILSEANRTSLLIPQGFAHGFQTLEEDCELLYLHSHPFVPAAEGGLHPSDPRLQVAWPLAVTELSPRDQAHPLLADAFPGLSV